MAVFLLTSVGFAIGVIVFTVQWLLQFRRKCHQLSLLPGRKKSNVVLGDLPALIGRAKFSDINFHGLIFQSMVGLSVLYRKEGLCRVWIAYDPYVLLFSAEAIEPVINNPGAMSKSRDYELLHCWLGTGLLTSTGEKWKSRRRLITPSFHYNILHDFIPIFDHHSKLLVNQLEKFVGKQGFDIVPIISLFTLDVICETAMGVKLRSQEGKMCEYAKSVICFGDIFIKRVMKPWLRNDLLFFRTSDGERLKKALRILHEMTSQVIERRKQEVRSYAKTIADEEKENAIGSRKRKAFLDLLLEKQQEDSSLNDEHICEEVHTFIFEGHDTTSMGISWALYHLGCNPQVQRKVHDELQCIFGTDKERAITTDDLREMKYLESVIKECQRISPSVPIASRYVTREINIKGYTIPSGSTIVFFIYALHHDPQVFPNPDVFDPDRFLPENCSGRHPYAYIPFSVGSRNCIGQKFAMMEMKITISNIIRNYWVESVDPPYKILRSALMILRSEGGLRLKLRKRE